MVTVLTRTIGPSGRDYASFTLAEADVENIGTSADLVANDEAIVFEADAGTYTGAVTFSSALVTDATRNVTYKPASGSEHGGQQAAGVIIETSSGHATTVLDSFVVLEGLNLSTSDSSGYGTQLRSAGAAARNCILTSPWVGALIYRAGTISHPTAVQNCACYGDTHAVLVLEDRAGQSTFGLTVNCTAIGNTSRALQLTSSNATGTINHECINMLVLGDRGALTSGAGTTNLTGSNNFGPSTDPFPAAIQGSPATITATTSFSTPLGSGDYAVYMGATGALADVTGNDVWQQGVGPASNSDVPTTDINGVTRSGTSCNPGAFEADGFVAPTTITKTIGSGKDYASFTLAEAAVTSIGSGTDLTFYNEAIVFEADAGTYSESVTFSSTLTTDATRNVTYKAAAGSEHGGDPSTGVIVQATITAALTAQENYIVFDGLHAKGSYGFWNASGAGGTVCRNLIITSTGNYGLISSPAGLIPVAPITVENCVISGAAVASLDLRPTTVAGTTAYDVRNCTLIGTKGIRVGQTGVVGSVLDIDAINNLVLFADAWVIGGSGTTNVSGSNNFSEGGGLPFPAALQGSPYPITATTAPEQPQAGDFAIHDNNGRLYNVTTNDVWQAGIGPASDSDVPTTDILGATRSGTTANPGAFELGVGESNEPPALPGLANATPDFRVHLDRRVTDATTGVSSTYDASTNTTTFTLPYKLNTAATMQVVTRKTSSANAGQSLTVVSTDATNRRVVVSGNHTGTAVFIGEKYTMKYEFSELHLQRNKNTYAAEPITAASHRVRYGRVNYGQTSFFKVTVTPKGGTSSTYVFNGNLLNEPETQLGSVALYDGHFQFPVLADHDRVTIELENDSPLPSRFLSCEWESFYHSRIGSRSRY